MKRKRLDRDGWGFEGFPYYQMRIDTDDFHGLACFIQLLSGQYCYWEMPKAGKIAVCGKGMVWLQLIPDGKHHIITAKYLPQKKCIQGVEYPYSVSIWYVDVIDALEYDEDGVAAFIDLYLDVIFSPQGDIKIDDRDELDAAYESGELSRTQYEGALAEAEEIQKDLCADIEKTEIFCSKILAHILKQIEKGQA